MQLPTVVTDLLPSQSSRAIATLTIPVSLAVSSLPHFLSQKLPSVSTETIILSQVTLFLATALLGLILILASTLLHYSGQPAKWPTQRYTSLSMDRRLLLALCSISNPTVKKVSDETIMSLDSTEYWISVLRDGGSIEPSEPLRLTALGHIQSAVI